MPDWVIPLITAIVAGGGGLYTGFKKNRNDLVDQLQEERAARTSENDKLHARIDLLYADKHYSRIYVASLIAWGNAGTGPPGPDAPEGYIP